MSERPGGSNPMRWDCQDGVNCYNHKARPKIEVFGECFGNGITFGDVDGIVEVSGHFLLLEWKHRATNIPTGQSRMYCMMTREPRFTVLCVAGSAETMVVTHAQVFRGGSSGGWQPHTLAEVMHWVRCWYRRTRRMAA